MPFQEFVSSGFGLWNPDCNHETNVNRTRKQRRDFESGMSQRTSEAHVGIISEERESEQQTYHGVGEDRDLEEMALSLVENRNGLMKHLQKSEKAAKEMEAENERVRAENESLRAENEKLKADNEKWKSHVEKMITDTRVSLEEIRRQASETVRLQNENEKLRKDNKYRHLLMKQMKKHSEMESKKRSTSIFGMNSPCG